MQLALLGVCQTILYSTAHLLVVKQPTDDELGWLFKVEWAHKFGRHIETVAGLAETCLDSHLTLLGLRPTSLWSSLEMLFLPQGNPTWKPQNLTTPSSHKHPIMEHRWWCRFESSCSVPKHPLVFLGFGCPMTEMGALVREKLAGAQKSLFSPWNKGCHGQFKCGWGLILNHEAAEKQDQTPCEEEEDDAAAGGGGDLVRSHLL